MPNVWQALPLTGSNPSQYLYFQRLEKTGSKEYATHFSKVCEIPAPDIYRAAFDRWKGSLPAQYVGTKCMEADIRVFIGLSDPSLYETTISLMLPYGVPYLPGSACKGLARRVALAVCGAGKSLMPATLNALFGDSNENGVGCVIFHDAWWVPASARVPQADGFGGNAPDAMKKNLPLVREVVTPHHKDFMDGKLDKEGSRMPATPFDNPVPVPQIAAHGKFLFAVEGGAAWTALAMHLLTLGLAGEGIGARTPEYGTFGARETAVAPQA